MVFIIMKGGAFLLDRTVNWGAGVSMQVKICLGWNDCDDWVVVGYSEGGGDDKILWKCRFSEYASIPPKITGRL
jgi:hypothetical protein